MISVGIIGGAGYTAGELLRLLRQHPETEVVFVQSRSQAELELTCIHADLVGDYNLRFVKEMPSIPDVLFICSGHGRSRAFIEKNKLPSDARIIDLSSDYRHESNAEDFIYGLPEFNRDQIRSSTKIANPGCFATAIQLALIPLAHKKEINETLHIHALTGSTGAGQKPTETTHFSWRNGNVSIYKPFTHQHLVEIKESLKKIQPSFNSSVNFLPVRGAFARGIFASLYMNSDLRIDEIRNIYQEYYSDHPFVHITVQDLDLKQVLNTNKCLLNIQKIDQKVLILSAIDNLIKGASGQAIQNMNIMFGLEETTGLLLKGSAF